jgi:hypothetical protein
MDAGSQTPQWKLRAYQVQAHKFVNKLQIPAANLGCGEAGYLLAAWSRVGYKNDDMFHVKHSVAMLITA